MKKRWIIAVGAVSLALLTGCGGSSQVYEQAGKDLNQGSYEYALQGYEQCIADGTRVADSYRGAGIANLRMGNYEAAIEAFDGALSVDKISKTLKQDVLYYRATANYYLGNYDAVMADCQTLSEEFSDSAETAFLTACAALAMDSYSEASTQFDKAFEYDKSYDMAIRIYQTYQERDMEADGTSYLERALSENTTDSEDSCERGRVYYYMEDYGNAEAELQKVSEENDEALLLLGMVYTAQGNTDSARNMYNTYVSRAENPAKGYDGLANCDIINGNYDSALANIESGISTATTEVMQSLLFNEIVVYEKKLDFATAKQKAEEYLAMFPEDSAAAREFTFLKSRTGEL